MSYEPRTWSSQSNDRIKELEKDNASLASALTSVTSALEKSEAVSVALRADLDYNVHTAEVSARIIVNQRRSLRQERLHNNALRSELDSLC
jgi:hypothetical protein